MSYYPPAGFHFRVKFEGLDKDVTDDVQFQSVGGLSVEMETEEFTEGGENHFKHTLPGRTKFPNLVLKRGLFKDSAIISWCERAFEDFEFKPISLVISLYSEAATKTVNKKEEFDAENSKPLITWKISHAIPVKWAIDDLNSQESKIVMETLELSYNYFKIEVNAN
ncbi:MAG: phage tail protein [Crocinitomicaceae bacterium]